MTNHVKIRKITINDTTAYFKMANIEDDPALKYVHGLVVNNFEEAKKQVEFFSKLDFKHDFGFLICRNQIPVGFILATQDRVFTECLNVAAYCKKNCRGMGIMTEAMDLLIDYCKKHCHHTFLLLDIAAENSSSLKSAEKLGANLFCNVQYDNAVYCRYVKKI